MLELDTILAFKGEEREVRSQIVSSRNCQRSDL